MVAAGKGRLSEVLTLLANGADATLASRDGSSAAQWASKMGFPAVAQAISTHLEVQHWCPCLVCSVLWNVGGQSRLFPIVDWQLQRSWLHPGPGSAPHCLCLIASV